MEIRKSIEKYIEQLRKPNHRFKSWEHCYKAFSDYSNIDYLALQLAFYLASWGMYRGSSELLQKDYFIHMPIIEILKSNRNLRKDNVTCKDVDQINKVISTITKTYELRNVSRTLTTKILLGTFGCTPAIDRYFKCGWKECEETKKLPINIENIVFFAERHKEEINFCKNIIPSDIIYPTMKIVDMYFWQIGYDNCSLKK